MLLTLSMIATQVGAYAGAQDAKLRHEQSLPPPPYPPDPTWGDKLAGVFMWMLVFLPVFCMGTAVAAALFIIIKIAFVRQGIAFP